MHRLKKVHHEIAKMEKMTSFGDWSTNPAAPASDEENAAFDWSKIERKKLTNQLGRQSSRLAYIQAAVNCTIEATNFTLRELQIANLGLEREDEKLERKIGRFERYQRENTREATLWLRANSYKYESLHKEPFMVRREQQVSAVEQRAELLSSGLLHIKHFGGLDQRLQVLQDFV